MPDTTASRARRVGSICGLILILVSPALALAQWHTSRQALHELARIEARRIPGDSAMHASAVYHAVHARASVDRRWQPTGHATLGIAGTLLGAVLLMIGRRRPTS